MDKHRRDYINELRVQIRQQETTQRRNKATIERFRNAENTTDFTRDKIASLKETIADSEKKVEELQTELGLAESGKRDDEIQKRINADNKSVKKRVKESQRIKKEKAAIDAKEKKRSEEYYQNTRQAWRDERQKERDYRYGYKRFCKLCNEVPDYLKRSLSNMPNNKGFIWRGMWLLGELPEEPGEPRVMFERKGKDVLLIHEYDEHETKVWEKRGKGKGSKRTLIKHEYRRKRMVL